MKQKWEVDKAFHCTRGLYINSVRSACIDLISVVLFVAFSFCTRLIRNCVGVRMKLVGAFRTYPSSVLGSCPDDD
jgi:hypothetical protein